MHRHGSIKYDVSYKGSINTLYDRIWANIIYFIRATVLATHGLCSACLKNFYFACPATWPKTIGDHLNLKPHDLDLRSMSDVRFKWFIFVRLNALKYFTKLISLKYFTKQIHSKNYNQYGITLQWEICNPALIFLSAAIFPETTKSHEKTSDLKDLDVPSLARRRNLINPAPKRDLSPGCQQIWTSLAWQWHISSRARPDMHTAGGKKTDDARKSSKKTPRNGDIVMLRYLGPRARALTSALSQSARARQYSKAVRGWWLKKKTTRQREHERERWSQSDNDEEVRARWG